MKAFSTPGIMLSLLATLLLMCSCSKGTTGTANAATEGRQAKRTDMDKKPRTMMLAVGETAFTVSLAENETARELAMIAGIDCRDFAMQMFSAGSDLSSKSEEELLYQDYKKFEFKDMKIGIGQITSVNAQELGAIRERMEPFLRRTMETKGLDMLFFMLTDIIEESTQLLFYGEKAGELVKEAFPDAVIDGCCAKVTNMVSRKKQVVPALMAVINRPDV